MYVDELVGPDTVNTLPPNTIEACADHCDVTNRVETGREAYKLIDNLKDQTSTWTWMMNSSSKELTSSFSPNSI